MTCTVDPLNHFGRLEVRRNNLAVTKEKIMGAEKKVTKKTPALKIIRGRKSKPTLSESGAREVPSQMEDIQPKVPSPELERRAVR